MISRRLLCLDLAATVAGLLTFGSAQAAAEDVMIPVPDFVMISGRDFQAIQAAMPEFNHRGGQLKDFKISVWDDAFNVVVSFTLIERPEGLRGGLPGEFDVYLNKNDLTFVRVGYQR